MSSLYDYQLKAIKKMKNGCILCGGVGSGKSRTALAYYFQENGGKFEEALIPMKNPPQDLYIITTARKRDTLEWDSELATFLMSTDPEKSFYHHNLVIDSWNNIQKYQKMQGAFFIFDEQRVVGHGAWVRSFLKIAKVNNWILLSATPGDTWMDYVPVFIANGFYRNRTEFITNHVVYSRFSKFPKVSRYLGTGRLIRLRNSILVNMDFHRQTISHHEDIYTDYDHMQYKYVMKNRWDIFNQKPIENASELCYTLRKVVNTNESRLEAVEDLVKLKHKAIIFYNFDYELEMLKSIAYGPKVEVAEWNGHLHQPLPEGQNWVYLVQYNAGCEGWNCVKTDTIIFYSQNYSYKTLIQASGRIDRLNTPYTDLYYYHLKSRSSIDLAIAQALLSKRKFNEGSFAG
mgnify:CR=1 FL=1